MKTVINVADRMSKLCHKVGFYIVIVCGIMLLSSMMVGVVTRWLLISCVWPEELSRYCMVWVAFIGGSVAMGQNELIGFEFVINMFKGKGRICVILTGKIALLLFLIWFNVAGMQQLPDYFAYKSMAMKLPMGIPYLGLTIGSIFMIIHTVTAMLHDLAKLVGMEDVDAVYGIQAESDMPSGEWEG